MNETDESPQDDLADLEAVYDRWFQERAEEPFLWFDDEPNLVLPPGGARVCSTSQALVSDRLTFSWDVNGWYRRLGVPWPYVNASKATLSRCYIASGGQQDAQSTYYLKRLLDPLVRDAYDRSPLGLEFLDDDYVQDRIRASINDEVARRRAAGVDVDLLDVLADHGFRTEPVSPVDEQPDRGDRTVQRKASGWGYGYWLWNSDLDHESAEQKMRAWQELLVSRLAHQRVTVTIGVGITGMVYEARQQIREADGELVVFLREDVSPGPVELHEAASAVAQWFSRN